MKKELSEMSLEELWELFPIFLVPPNPKWKEYYEEMKSTLLSIIQKDYIISINHIGSTAIKGIWAKNIIDILIEITEDKSLGDVCNLLVNRGFNLMFNEENKAALNYGYTKEGFAEKVYHIHLHYKGDIDEIYFRDYLNEHHDVAKEYEKLKVSLWKKFEHNRNAYTDAKTDFIRSCMANAK